jgi:regulatory protein
VEGIVTAIQPQQRRGGKRVNVFVDGRYAFSLQQELAELVRVGQPISELKTAELLLEDEMARALESALAFLSYRPRSEREVRDRLKRKEVPPAIVDAVVERLKQLKYLDDDDFARYWVEQRQTHRPRGARLLRLELQRKGISTDTAAEVLEESSEAEDPAEAAYRAAQRKAHLLRLADEREFQQKIGQFLLRRGFDYETARAATRRLWSEVQ